MRSPENRDLPDNQLNNCANFDLNFKNIFLSYRGKQEKCSGGGGSGVTILNPVYPRLSSGYITTRYFVSGEKEQKPQFENDQSIGSNENNVNDKHFTISFFIYFMSESS